MTNTIKEFKRIYKKSAAEKIRQALGILLVTAVYIVIVAGILGVDLL